MVDKVLKKSAFGGTDSCLGNLSGRHHSNHIIRTCKVSLGYCTWIRVNRWLEPVNKGELMWASPRSYLLTVGVIQIKPKILRFEQVSIP